MSTSPDSETTRISALIDKTRLFWDFLNDDGKKTFVMHFKGVQVNDFVCDPPIVNLREVRPGVNVFVKERKINPLHVLVRDFRKLKPKIVVHSVKSNFREIAVSVRRYVKFLEAAKTHSVSVIPRHTKIKSHSQFKLNAHFKTVKDFIVPLKGIKDYPISEIASGKIFNQSMTFKPLVGKFNESYLITLTIDKKPLQTLLFNDNELDFFRSKLSDQVGISKRSIKISFIYDKFYVKSFQNVDYDPKTRRVSCNFKPRKEIKPDDTLAYLVLATRKDNNTTVSAMVSYNDFWNYRNA